MSVSLDFFSDPVQFLEVAGSHLTADPVVSTVVATVAVRTAQEIASGLSQSAGNWYVVAREAGRIVGTGMRTAPFEPRPVFVLPMPVEAALMLARTLHARGEEVGGVNGSLPAASSCAQETARLTGRDVEVAQHTRLFELSTLHPPRPVPGRLRSVTRDELDLATGWMCSFMADADEQAERTAGSRSHGSPTRTACSVGSTEGAFGSGKPGGDLCT